MTKLAKLSAVSIAAVFSSTVANAALVDFSGDYEITTDTGVIGTLDAGDTLSLTNIDVDSAIDVPGLGSGDTIADLTIETTVGANVGETFDFSAGALDFSVGSTTVVTSVPSVFTVVTGGGGLLGTDSGSWYIAITSEQTSGGFLGQIETPPGNIPGVDPIPLPAGAWLLLSGLGAAAFVRRKRA